VNVCCRPILGRFQLRRRLLAPCRRCVYFSAGAGTTECAPGISRYTKFFLSVLMWVCHHVPPVCSLLTA